MSREDDEWVVESPVNPALDAFRKAQKIIGYDLTPAEVVGLIRDLSNVIIEFVKSKKKARREMKKKKLEESTKDLSDLMKN